MEDFTHKEFSIERMPDMTFRVAEISPIEMLALSPQINFENFQMTKILVQFALEHVEVKMGDKWVAVKVKDREIYWPQGIEKNILALNDIFMYIFEEVIAKVFTQSNE